jgi:hypothetical protein
MSDEIRITVHPATVPTTAAPFHESATHVDALGMPVAFGEHTIQGHTERWTYHPTPCCGAAASISDPIYGMYCKACYEQVDPAFGNVPLEPFRPIEREEA